MPRAALPWLFPIGLLAAVLLVVLTGFVVAGLIWIAACFVGIPLLWREWERNRAQQRGSDGRGPFV